MSDFKKIEQAATYYADALHEDVNKFAENFPGIDQLSPWEALRLGWYLCDLYSKFSNIQGMAHKANEKDLSCLECGCTELLCGANGVGCCTVKE